ncbi:hypothetical protein Tco_1323710 [Tanacetum coccineum]
MLNPSPNTGIDSIFNLNTELTSLIDVPVTTIAEPPLLSTTTLPPLPTPLITHLQQTPIPTPATALSSSLQDLPNFGSLFGFSNKMHEAIKTVVQLQFEKLRDEAQAENADFINKLDDNIKKIIKEQIKLGVQEKKSEKKTRVSKSTEGSKSHHKSVDESAQAEKPMQTSKDLEEPAHQEFKTGVTEDQPNK